jgi:hypothetical protein
LVSPYPVDNLDTYWSELDYYLNAKRKLLDYIDLKERSLITNKNYVIKRLRRNRAFDVYWNNVFRAETADLYNLLRLGVIFKGGAPRNMWKKIDAYNDIEVLFSMSSLSKGPFTTNIEQEMYQRFRFPLLENENSKLIDRNIPAEHKEIIELVKKLADSQFLAEKVKEGFDLADIPQEYRMKDNDGDGWQPWHIKYIPLVFEQLKGKGLISVETLVYFEQDDKMFAGHIDLIIRIGDTIYVCDYKPEVDFDLNPDHVSDIFMDTIPQVSGYGVLFGKNIAEDLKKNPNLKLRCLTFNRDDYLVTY